MITLDLGRLACSRNELVANIKADIVMPRAKVEKALPAIKRTMARYCPNLINRVRVASVVMIAVNIRLALRFINGSPCRNARAIYIAMGMAIES